MENRTVEVLEKRIAELEKKEVEDRERQEDYWKCLASYGPWENI